MKAVRPLVGCVALLSIVTGATGRPPDSAVLIASEAPALVLNLHFTSSDSLPIASRRALMAEAESIWKNGHVRLKWLRESTEADEGDILRVLVVARPVPRTSEFSAWTVAELMRLNATQATAALHQRLARDESSMKAGGSFWQNRRRCRISASAWCSVERCLTRSGTTCFRRTHTRLGG